MSEVEHLPLISPMSRSPRPRSASDTARRPRAGGRSYLFTGDRDQEAWSNARTFVWSVEKEQRRRPLRWRHHPRESPRQSRIQRVERRGKRSRRRSPQGRQDAAMVCRGCTASSGLPKRRPRRRRCLGSQRATAAPNPTNVLTTAQPRALDATHLRSGRGGLRQCKRTPEDYGAVRRENPNAGGQTLHRKAVLAAGFPLRRDGDRPASNRKCVTRSVPHSTDANEKPAICRLFNSGGGTRTRDLRV